MLHQKAQHKNHKQSCAFQSEKALFLSGMLFNTYLVYIILREKSIAKPKIVPVLQIIHHLQE